MSGWRLPLLLLAGALQAFPSVGRAAVLRTVCHSGCVYTSITVAGNFSSKGDRIEVMPGTYDEQVIINNQVSIFGAPGEPRPLIEWSGSGAAFTR
jgi:hypothetical protein